MKLLNLKITLLALALVAGNTITAGVRPALAGLVSGAVGAALAMPFATIGGPICLIPWLSSPLLGKKIGDCKSRKEVKWVKACDTLSAAITLGSLLFLFDKNITSYSRDLLVPVLAATAVKGLVTFGCQSPDPEYTK